MIKKLNSLFLIISIFQTLSWADEKPNIFFILLDDLGKEWISDYGAEEINTPNIDEMTQQGMRFENFYSMPQCTPTRMSFMTGQYPYRNGWVNHWDVPRWGGGCHYDWNKNPSVARVMKSARYKTVVAGKWQVNDFRVQPEAMKHHGFDDYCMWTGYEAGNASSSKRYWDPYIHTQKGSKTYEGQFGEDIFSDFLIDFIKQNSNDPMFLYYAMCLPHGPLVTTPLEPNVSEKIDKHKAMVRYVDLIVGKLKTAVNNLKLSRKTIFILTTDNGTSGSIPGKLRGRIVKGGKTKTTENGINGPFIAYAPGLVPANTVTTALCDVTDLLPTFAELGSATLPKDVVFDGVSFASVLKGETQNSKRKWIMSMGGKNQAKRTDQGIENMWYYRDRVVRDERFKLWISPAKKAVKLIDLHSDVLETENLINNPEYDNIVKKLMAAVTNNFDKDQDPIYTPLAEEKWDVPVKAKSEDWKFGKPGEAIDYKPDSQVESTPKKSKKKKASKK